MHHLFAYGTLMSRGIMREVSGFQLSNMPGRLKGYSRRSVKYETDPALLPDKESRVASMVYRNVPNSGWERFDRFEGKMYACQIVPIELNDGVRWRAVTYIVQPNFLDCLDQSDWDFADFLRNGKASSQVRYKGYQLFKSNLTAGV